MTERFALDAHRCTLPIVRGTYGDRLSHARRKWRNRCVASGLLGLCFYWVGAQPGVADDLSAAMDKIDLPVPSGQSLEFYDIAQAQPEDGIMRVRFLAPEIRNQERNFDEVADDMTYLCQEVILPAISTGLLQNVRYPERIIISLMDAPVEFGSPAPDVTQYFESYAVQDDKCIWELF